MINFRKAIVLIISINVLALGLTSAYHVGKYIDEHYWDPPDYRDMNGTPHLPWLISFTIVCFTIAFIIGIIEYFRKREEKWKF